MTKYIVWCPELGSTADDGKTISAYDEFEAAAMWARLTVRRPRAATKENCCD